jgi:hypothetical protein
LTVGALHNVSIKSLLGASLGSTGTLFLPH